MCLYTLYQDRVVLTCLSNSDVIYYGLELKQNQGHTVYHLHINIFSDKCYISMNTIICIFKAEVELLVPIENIFLMESWVCSFLCLLFLLNMTLLIAVLQSDVLLCGGHMLVFKHSLSPVLSLALLSWTPPSYTSRVSSTAVWSPDRRWKTLLW